MVQKNLFAGQQWETDTENRLTDMGKGEERVRSMERVTWKLYFTICKIESQQEFAVWLRKLKQGLCYQPRGVGWGGRWAEGSKGRGYMYAYG